MYIAATKPVDPLVYTVLAPGPSGSLGLGSTATTRRVQEFSGSASPSKSLSPWKCEMIPRSIRSVW